MQSRHILPLLVVLASPVALAQSATPAAAPATTTPANPAPAARPLSGSDAAFLDQQADLVRQLRLLELQTRVAEQQKKLREANAPSANAPAASPGGDSVNLPPSILRPGSAPQAAPVAATPMPALPPVSAPDEGADLSVASVWGVEGNYAADMLAAGGMRVSVRRGASLPGGWKVAQISRTGVVIEKGRTRRTLLVGR